MKKKATHFVTITSIVLAILTCAVLAAQQAVSLYINGVAASNDVRIIHGKAYVPLADIARALNMVVVQKDGRCELTMAGGANQIANKNTGKLGEEIFTGQWRFKVLGVERVNSYNRKFSERNKIIEAKTGNELIIVSCRVKNGTKQKDELVFEEWDGNNTCLTTADEESWRPTDYDVRETEYSPVGAEFIPGAAINFNIVFQVPKDTAVKDLIFTALRYNYRASFDQKNVRSTDIRISLQ